MPITFEEATAHVWPGWLGSQLVGWMVAEAQRNPAVKAELERFIAALTPDEAELLLDMPFRPTGRAV